jgi:hypothetical protein
MGKTLKGESQGRTGMKNSRRFDGEKNGKRLKENLKS